ncbi:enoyl-CoA hydratase/isomerase family protein [Segnochrobactrum spirostomi]|uniref:Enoyl-CoA hydratase/isomerase family protein n=1 Tax=Segnochrobactrum spirostomi TaxID=2608987 RepID=A0A6A7YA24_9HYPH|nr:enoyl-CoA hydratase/isomerase family protein [Segnochrobactrum spirostomi]MQT15625.1 enoyl-CoA hydratase/isomerase family protein [Segnochrobactrum spirostomi]
MEIDDHGGGVYGVVFTRTADGNHLTSPQIADFAATLDRVLAKPDLKAVVLSGEGAHFCAGRIGAKGLTSAADVRDDLNLILEVNSRLRSSPVPFVAAVEGKAFGFGCGFSTQCDVTIAGDGAVFALPEMSHKLPPLIVLSYFGKFVPFKKAFELALTSREFGAAEAKEIGIVTEVVPTGGAFERALAFARTIAELDAESVQLLRAFARRVAGLSDDIEARNGVATMAIALAARASAH